MYFREGSVIVHYYAVFDAEEAFENYDAIEALLYEVYQELLIIPTVGGYSVNDDYLQQYMLAEIADSK